jgi:general secretion pathway protein K
MKPRSTFKPQVWRHVGPRQAGIALVGVLWMVAALSLIVAGMVKVTRQDARTVSASKQGVLAEAYGQAAIVQTVQRMQIDPTQYARYTRFTLNYQGAPIQVTVVPLNGLINLNGAPAGLLSKLFRVAGGLPAPTADALAQQVVTLRDRPDSKGTAVGFDAVEDLLQVPGVDYDLYANIARLLVVGRRSVTRVNALAATPEVLMVLAGGDAAVAQQLVQARQVAGSSPDTTRLDAAFVDNSSGSRYRLMASLSLDSGRWWSVSRDIDLNRNAPDGQPWRIFGADRRMISAP